MHGELHRRLFPLSTREKLTEACGRIVDLASIDVELNNSRFCLRASSIYIYSASLIDTIIATLRDMPHEITEGTGALEETPSTGPRTIVPTQNVDTYTAPLKVTDIAQSQVIPTSLSLSVLDFPLSQAAAAIPISPE